MNIIPDLLTIPEAAEALRCSERTIHRLIEHGHLRPVRLKGRRTRFIERRDLEAYAAHREPAGL